MADLETLRTYLTLISIQCHGWGSWASYGDEKPNDEAGGILWGSRFSPLSPVWCCSCCFRKRVFPGNLFGKKDLHV